MVDTFEIIVVIAIVVLYLVEKTKKSKGDISKTQSEEHIINDSVIEGAIIELTNIDELRQQFKVYLGPDKYEHLVLNLTQGFFYRKRLLYWESEIFNNFSEVHGLGTIDLKSAFLIFNRCPIHDIELKKDSVDFVDGDNVVCKLPYEESLKTFPLAHINFPINMNHDKRRGKAEVLYCSKCREFYRAIKNV